MADRQPLSDLLRVEDLHVRFATPAGAIQAVRGVSFGMRPATTLAVVGESGSGKSVRQPEHPAHPAAQRRDHPGARSCSPIRAAPARRSTWRNCRPTGRQMRAIRGGRISIIFQEPMSSLSPLHTIGDQVGEALRLHRRVDGAEATRTDDEMLRLVGFPDPSAAWRSYPFELSGGLRQRAMIAMALVCRPALLIADEPTTALDVTIQAQILKLIVELQQRARHGRAADHARSRRGRQHRRGDRRDVSRRGDGERHARRHLRARRSIPICRRCCARCRAST